MKHGKFEKRKKRAPLWYYILLILLICVFVGSVWYLADYFLGSRKQAAAYDDLAALVDSVRGTEPAEEKRELRIPSQPMLTKSFLKR